MDVLPWHFQAFRIFGLHYKNPKQFQPCKLFYKSFMVSLTIHFTVGLFTTLLMMSDQGVEAFTAGLFLTFTYIAASFKLINFILHRVKIDDLLNGFRLEVCKAQNDREIQILEKYQYMAKKTFAVRMITTMGCNFFFLSVALINLNSKNLELPYNAYQVLNISNPFSYVIAYGAQLITVIFSSCIDVTLDSTAWAFIILVCGQLELLSQRIVNSKRIENRVLIKYCVEHHNLIFVMVHKVQSCFISIIVPSFISALITLCSSIFQLAQRNNSIVSYLPMIAYIICILVQLYYYCWFGNELQLKNETVTNAIFQLDWFSMKPCESKDCWFVMFMGQKELVISYHGQCVLNIRTLLWMLEATYAAFNVLQQVSI